MPEKTTSNLICKKDILVLFAKMDMIWKDKRLSAQDSDMTPEVNIWLCALRKLTPKQISTGLLWCAVNCDYPPSIAQFKKAALGIKEPAIAYTQIETDPIAKLAISKCDTWYMKQASVSDAKNHFVAHYKSIVDQLLSGDITV